LLEALPWKTYSYPYGKSELSSKNQGHSSSLLGDLGFLFSTTPPKIRLPECQAKDPELEVSRDNNTARAQFILGNEKQKKKTGHLLTTLRRQTIFRTA